MTEITWTGLSKWEQSGLISTKQGESISFDLWRVLRWWQLVTNHYTNTPDGVLGELTPAGRALLASADARPTTITAEEFVRDGYKAKIEAGECDVTWDQSGLNIIDIVPHSPALSDWLWPYKITYSNSVVFGLFEDKALFAVRWLTNTALPPLDESNFTTHRRFKHDLSDALYLTAVEAYSCLWNIINGKSKEFCWAMNPRVCVHRFSLVKERGSQ